MTVPRLSGQLADQGNQSGCRDTGGQIAEPAADFSRRQQVHGVVPDFGEIGFLVSVDTHGGPHDVGPPGETPDIAAPIGAAFVPTTIVVAPDGIGVVENVHGEPDPITGTFDLVEHGDTHLAQKMPRPIAVTRIGTPQMSGAKVPVHLVAADLHHSPATFPLLLRQQVMDEAVSANEVVGVGHAGFVVVAVTGGSLRVPLGAVQQNPLCQLSVFVLAAQQPSERQRSCPVQCGRRVGPIAPPDLAPRVAAPHRSFRVLRRLGRRRWLGHQPVALTDEFLELIAHRPFGQLAQTRQVLRTQEQPRMRPGDPRQ